MKKKQIKHLQITVDKTKCGAKVTKEGSKS